MFRLGGTKKMLQFRQLRRKSDLTIAQLRDRLVKQVSPQIRPHAPSLGIEPKEYDFRKNMLSIELIFN